MMFAVQVCIGIYYVLIVVVVVAVVIISFYVFMSIG